MGNRNFHRIGTQMDWRKIKQIAGKKDARGYFLDDEEADFSNAVAVNWPKIERVVEAAKVACENTYEGSWIIELEAALKDLGAVE